MDLDRPHSRSQGSPATGTIASSPEQEALELDQAASRPLSRIATVSSTAEISYGPVRPKFLRYWRRHISLIVPHVKCRDHLANERTFLGYLRSAQAFSMLGVFIAQMMRLNYAPNPNPILGYFAVSIPLACVCHVTAVIMTVVGCIRFLKYQKTMALGGALSGGWEISTVGVLAFLVLLFTFALVLAITIDKG